MEDVVDCCARLLVEVILCLKRKKVIFLFAHKIVWCNHSRVIVSFKGCYSGNRPITPGQ